MLAVLNALKHRSLIAVIGLACFIA